jgi:hypothetical protein
MSSLPQAVGAPRRGSATALYAIVASAIAMAMVGGVLALGFFNRPAGHHPRGTEDALKVGRVYQTGFGVISVDSVLKLTPHLAKALASAHGTRHDVRRGTVDLRVAVSLTNLSHRPASFSPGQYRLRIGQGGRWRSPDASTLKAGPLAAKRDTKTILSFVVPAKSKGFWLEYDESARTNPLLFHLGASTYEHGH